MRFSTCRRASDVNSSNSKLIIKTPPTRRKTKNLIIIFSYRLYHAAAGEGKTNWFAEEVEEEGEEWKGEGIKEHKDEEVGWLLAQDNHSSPFP